MIPAPAIRIQQPSLAPARDKRSSRAVSLLSTLPRDAFTRHEVAIAVARMPFALVILLAISVAPPATQGNATQAFALLALYLAFAATAGIAVAKSWQGTPTRPVLGHVLEVVLLGSIWWLTGRQPSLFFMCLTFLTMSAWARWHWRGVTATTVPYLALFVASSAMGAGPVDRGLSLDVVISRSVYLATTAGLVACFGAVESLRRARWSRVATLSVASAGGGEGVARAGALQAAAILQAQRVLVLWETTDEPWLNAACAVSGGVDVQRLAPDAYGTVVHETLATDSFLTYVEDESPAVIVSRESGANRPVRLDPFNPRLREAYGIRSAIVCPLRGDLARGWVIVLDQQWLDSEDVLLALAVSDRIAKAMDHELRTLQLASTAATRERANLSRDLHDGMLQMLTGLALKLETLSRHPAAAGDFAERLLEMKRVMEGEQRDLRLVVGDLASVDTFASMEPHTFVDFLHQSLRRVATVWGIQVRLDASGLNASSLPTAVRAGLHGLLREAAANAARHGSATQVDVRLRQGRGSVHAHVVDNGRAFSFRGRLTDDELTSRSLGPVSLKARIHSLGGRLEILSDDRGAQLDVELPLPVGAA